MPRNFYLNVLLLNVLLVRDVDACTATLARTETHAFASMNVDCSGCDGRTTYIPAVEKTIHLNQVSSTPDSESLVPTVTRKMYPVVGLFPRWSGNTRGTKLYETGKDNGENNPTNPEVETESFGEIEVPLFELENESVDKTITKSQTFKTNSYWESTLPLNNEKGLTLSESSAAAMIVNYPNDGIVTGYKKSEDGTTVEPIIDSTKASKWNYYAAPLGENLFRADAMIDIPSLMQIALEHCSTAICGVKTMGYVAEHYGFFPSLGEWSEGKVTSKNNRRGFRDGGEIVTLADNSGDAWVFHVMGGVDDDVEYVETDDGVETDSDGDYGSKILKPVVKKAYPKSIWVAKQLPKNHAAVMSNQMIIRDLPEDLSVNDDVSKGILFNSMMEESAIKSGLWQKGVPNLSDYGDGKVIDFTFVFTPDPVSFLTGFKPIPYYYSLRTWRIFSLIQPSSTWKLHLNALSYPFSIEIENPKDLTRETVFKWQGDLYENSEFDLSKGALAGPFGSPYPVEGGVANSWGAIPRGISIGRTTYSIVGEAPNLNLLSNKGKKSIAWYASDTPATSVYVPYIAGTSQHSPYYENGLQTSYSRDSAYWAFSFVNNFAKIMYNEISSRDIYPLKKQLQHMLIEKVDNKLLPTATSDSESDYLSDLSLFQTHLQNHVVSKWWELADILPAKYNDQSVFYPNVQGRGEGFKDWKPFSPGYPQDWAAEVGMTMDIHPIYEKRRDFNSEIGLSDSDTDSEKSKKDLNACPVVWDNSSYQWLYANPFNVGALEKMNKKEVKIGLEGPELYGLIEKKPDNESVESGTESGVNTNTNSFQNESDFMSLTLSPIMFGFIFLLGGSFGYFAGCKRDINNNHITDMLGESLV